ncbi:MAG: pyridoxal phosphate-dependent aminotransferase [Bacteroidaceae bacterium]|nr:pyridoxal phosphate-dependent aminotransferase [Bacteroidaceae bacterium]
MSIIDSKIIDEVAKELEIKDIASASIRQIGAIVRTVEQRTGVEYVHFEMGIPGLPPSQIGVRAECNALQQGVASQYPIIDGIQPLKEEASRFVKAFLDTDVKPAGCIPTVGSMQASFASLMLCSHLSPERDTVLYIDPGFPVQKMQAQVIGVKTVSFDVADYRGEKLARKIESYFAQGNICAILYSSPNNPSWMCLNEDELRIIGTLAAKYDVIVIEDLAYMTMDFRRDMSRPFEPPYQPTVAKYTDNYLLLISASKIFSYAGQRIAVACVSDKLYEKHYDSLQQRYGIARFGSAFAYVYLYTFSSGVSHSAQYAMAAMLKAACDGDYNFVYDIKEYATRTAKIKEILYRNGFHIVYDRDDEEPVSDGFFFTIGYGSMSGAELLKNLLYYGISGIDLSTTGSNRQGIRACSSNIKEHHYALLEERLKAFNDHYKKFK